MYKLKTMRPLMQAMGIITAVMVLVTGVTFAALQSQQAVLKGNSLATAMAELKISKDNSNYATVVDGYTYSNLIPGGSPTPSNGNPIYLQNTGSVALAAKISVNEALSNPNNVDLSKVHVILLPFGGGTLQNITLKDLVAASATGGIALAGGGLNHVNAGGNAGFAMQIMLDSDATSGSSANIGNLIFNFDATAVN
jgi:hypothetical protein